MFDWMKQKAQKKSASVDGAQWSQDEVDALAQIRLPNWPESPSLEWFQRTGSNQALLTLPFAAPTTVLTPLLEHSLLSRFDWSLHCNIRKLPNSQPDLPMIYGNVVLIASGKGGVGKSSVTAQLAVALARFGAKVGVLDADLYGPSMPTMFGQPEQKLVFNEQQKMIPHHRAGVHVSSLGYLSDAKDAAIWRGPMASAALQQLMRDTKWPALDYLLVDLPPGTGDIQLTFAQKLPITGAVIVTTPQTIALADAYKGITMFRKVGVPITGLIENMSGYTCPQCGHHEDLFGHSGGAETAAAENVSLLGQWPLDRGLRESLDAGQVEAILAQSSTLAATIENSAARLAAQLYLQAQDRV